MNDKFNRELFIGDKAIRIIKTPYSVKFAPVIIKDFTETKAVLGKRTRVNPENLILLSTTGLTFENESDE